MYFLKRKTQQKSETENEADDRKEKKKSWAKPNLSQVIIACGFSPEIQKSIFIRVWSRNIKSKPVLSRNTEEKQNSHISQTSHMYLDIVLREILLLSLI